MTYQHITNLAVPFSDHDLLFLLRLGDYRLGDPIPAKTSTALKLGELKAKNIVGLYVKKETITDPAIAKVTGWKNPDLGQKWVH